MSSFLDELLYLFCFFLDWPTGGAYVTYLITLCFWCALEILCSGIVPFVVNFLCYWIVSCMLSSNILSFTQHSM